MARIPRRYTPLADRFKSQHGRSRQERHPASRRNASAKLFGSALAPQITIGIDVAQDAVIMPADAVHRGRVFSQNSAPAYIPGKARQGRKEGPPPQHRIAATAGKDGKEIRDS